jgi:hypothetical protein
MSLSQWYKAAQALASLKFTGVSNPTSCLSLLVDRNLAGIADRKAALADADLTQLSSPVMLTLLMAWGRPLQELFRSLAAFNEAGEGGEGGGAGEGAAGGGSGTGAVPGQPMSSMSSMWETGGGMSRVNSAGMLQVRRAWAAGNS